MNIVEDIAGDFRRSVGAEISLLPEGTHRYVVSTPFTFDDGDEFVILLKKEPSGWFLTDEAHTFMHLSYEMDERDWNRGNRSKIIEKAVSMYDVCDENGELIKRVHNYSFGDALFDYIQALSRIADIRLLSREMVRSTFLEDFKHLVREAVPSDRRTFDWRDPEHDPDGIYPVDVRINGVDPPLFVYALHNNERVKDATISLLKFEGWGIPHRSAGVFEDIREIRDKELVQVMDVTGKLFSSLSGSRDRVINYLRDHLHGHVTH